jgi:hypothetical protein
MVWATPLPPGLQVSERAGMWFTGAPFSRDATLWSQKRLTRWVVRLITAMTRCAK